MYGVNQLYTFIYYRPIVERREFLIQNMTEIKGHIMFSEVKELHVSISTVT